MQYTLYYLFCYKLGFLEVLDCSSVHSAATPCVNIPTSFWPKRFYECKGMADACDRGFREELDDSLRRPTKSLQQWLLICFAFLCWIHHIHERLGGFPKNLQFLLPLPLLLAQRLDLPKAVGELFFSIGDYLLQPLDVIYMAIQHILHVSKQLFFVF
jgi:hypothetical protein